jgi:hypothetical protein
VTAAPAYVGTELELFRAARNWKRYLQQQIGPYVRGDVLEVGAGLGATTLSLHQASCASWTCLEPDPQLAAELSAAVRGLRDRDGRAPIGQVGTLADLPAHARYDCALYIDVLEHIEDDRGELQAAAAKLRDGAHLLVMSPAHQWLYSAFDRAIGHFRRYDKAGLGTLTPHGATLIGTRYLDCAGVAASLANRVLMRQAMPSAAQIATWDRLLVPLSTQLDALLGYRVGKSTLAIWRVDARG